MFDTLAYFLYIASIAYVKVVAMTGNVYGGGQMPNYGANPVLMIVLKNGREYRAELQHNKYQNAPFEIELSADSDFTPSLVCTREDIEEVYLKAGYQGNDGWYVASIDTYTAGTNKMYTKLTADPGFGMWVDFDEEFPYDAREHRLSKAITSLCVTYVRVGAMTGDESGAGVSEYERYGKNHLIVLILLNGAKLQAELEGPMERNHSYSRELHFASRFQTTQCVSVSDIREIHLQTQNGGDDSWYIASITTAAKTGDENYEPLTRDSHLEKWLDDNEKDKYDYDATDITLTWVDEESPLCVHGNPSCECNANADVCTFNLEIDEIRTFTSYQKLSQDAGRGIAMRGTQGVIYYLDDNGTPQPLQEDRKCAVLDTAECTDPQFVDGKTYRLAIAVNGLIPGPTLIVHEGQTVIIHVHSNLTTEGISIHWHGMHQRGTPWMDGVGQVTQCQIGPASSFSYRYVANPAGTFWYHSHSGAQRTDGFFGALIVKETPQRMARIKHELRTHGVFEDRPAKHTLTLLDWQHEPSLDLFTQINSGLGFYPNKVLGEVPTPDDDRYESTRSFDKGEVGPVPYYSGIINGKGRHVDVPYIKTRLSIFTVQTGKTYRFRLVGAQGLYAYRFSIDGHKLTVVATDGYWIEPIEDVDYIIIHSGERYDFLLHAKNSPQLKNYWIRAETLEIEWMGARPPYKSLGHVAEAILHYTQDGDSDDPDVNVPSNDYERIKNASSPIECTNRDPCKAVNCPFRKFHESYNIDCINVQSLRLLEQTPDHELPDANPKDPKDCKDCRHFINFNFEGDSQTSSVNGRNFIFPSSPPQIQYDDFLANDIKCDLNADCNPSTEECSCVHIIDIPQRETVQLVLTAIGAFDNAHPIHLHGHSFHVVYVGYPEYDPTTGFVQSHNSDIHCDDVNCNKERCETERCTRPRWRTGPRPFVIDSKTVRKDTVMVPAGGYVVINFLSDNPGYWFLHCHIEVHQLEGMAVILNEAGTLGPPPSGMNKCGNFEISEHKRK